MTSSRADIPQFLSDCAAQQSLYGEMFELARRQDALIGAGDLDALLELVARKQALLQKAAELDARCVAFRVAWKERRETLDAPTVQEVERAAAGVEEVLRRLVEQEKSSSALAVAARSQKQEEMRQGATAKRAFGAYAGRVPPGDSRFVDKTQ